MVKLRLVLSGTALAWAAAACGSAPRAVPAPTPEPGVEQRYAALPDTTVCVVDRTTERGLRDLAAKRQPDGDVVLLVSGKLQTLDALHPVGLVAGYAGREPWVAAGEPINLQGRRYEKVGPERLIRLDQVYRRDEYRAIPVFADPNDPAPPRALYVPIRPGCVFQAYVRADLLR